jgi:DNA-directed RNA polymerase subunit RPC12/RpoP
MYIKCPKCGSDNIGQFSQGKEYDFTTGIPLPINNTQYICSDCGFIVGRWEKGNVILNEYRNRN